MNKTEIYLEAARRVAEKEEWYSCHAVGRAETAPRDNYTSTPAVKAYQKVFAPGLGEVQFLQKITADSGSENFRVLMLCLMAVCWKDFDAHN